MTFSYLLGVKSAFPRVTFVAEREKTYFSEQKPSQCSLQSRGWRAQGESGRVLKRSQSINLSLSHSGSEIASDRPTNQPTDRLHVYVTQQPRKRGRLTGCIYFHTCKTPCSWLRDINFAAKPLTHCKSLVHRTQRGR
jgi:hypothetical protein